MNASHRASACASIFVKKRLRETSAGRFQGRYATLFPSRDVHDVAVPNTLRCVATLQMR
jgi:hypothetical protein